MRWQGVGPARHTLRFMSNPIQSLRDRVDIIIRVAFAAFVLIGCYFVLQPFLTAIVFAAILAVVTWPLFLRATNSLGGNRTIAAMIMVCILIITVLIPVALLCGVLASEIPDVVAAIRHWVGAGMPLPEWIGRIPYVGAYVTETVANIDTQGIVDLVKKTVDPATRWILSISMGVGNGLFQICLVAFVIFFLYRDGQSLAEHVSALLNRVSGNLAQEFSGILINTTRSVVFGVLGTAIGQGLVAGIGFFIAGVPGVTMLSLLVCVLSLIPVGPPLVWIPAALWLYTQGSAGMAIFLVLWGLLAVSSVDNFIKPILISRGTSLPLALVFLGVFGGIMSFGFLGIVMGPIFLAGGIALFKAWIARPRLNTRSRLGRTPREVTVPKPEANRKPS